MPTPYVTPRTLPALALAGVTSLLSACAPVPVQPPASAPVSTAAEAAPTATPCPKDLAPIARCLSGKDSAGAYYLVAVPQQVST